MASSFDRSERRWLFAATVGAAVSLVAFASVISGRGLVAWDAPVAARLVALPPLPARVVDVVGGTFVVAPLVALAAVFLWTTGRRWGAARVVLLPAAGEIATLAVKTLVARPRPAGSYATGYSFPSGHATDAAIMACLLAWFAFREPRGRALVVALVALALGWAALVAAMRVTLGVHYASDVLGGLGMGLAIAGAGLALLGRAQRAHR